MCIVADAGDSEESTVRREVPAAVYGIGEHVGVGMASQVKQWDVDLAIHQFHEAPSLAAKLAAYGPTLIFQSRVRRPRNLYRFTQVRDCFGEILRRSPLF